ncbi:M48 family metallopeptidase [Magnetofaba australis]|uniref:Putative metal-dependent hydrolase n=1 Tax=Magnetofaba australis IT-1 TaxID=1434232 RepID=A0A1Y2K254_9PROT|nr:YgjP-like metallopeptidase domain-containing protein [Magnetofaba australis]OSM01737.1 putative metal-dependent hydrolase [Magnetofaba australis IT-1]
MDQFHITLEDGSSCPVQVVRSPRRRTVQLVIRKDGAVTARTPKRINNTWLIAWAQERAPWITRKRSELLTRFPTSPTPLFEPGAPHLHLGKIYQLDPQLAARKRILIQGDRLVIHAHTPNRPEALAAQLDAWRADYAQRLFSARLARCFPPFAQMGFTRPTLRLRLLKRSWGNMRSDGRMTLNRDLIRAPLTCLDYVIVHELCHMAHMNHSPAYRALLTQMRPNWRADKALLERTLA